jgi:hypothetical protein
VEVRLADWLPFSGRNPAPARVIDSDISTVTSVADKVLRVEAEQPWLMHLEAQAGPDADCRERLICEMACSATAMSCPY